MRFGVVGIVGEGAQELLLGLLVAAVVEEQDAAFFAECAHDWDC